MSRSTVLVFHFGMPSTSNEIDIIFETSRMVNFTSFSFYSVVVRIIFIDIPLAPKLGPIKINFR